MSTATALDPRWAAVQAGLSRGWIETRQSFTESINLFTNWIAPVTYVVMLLVLRKITPPGSHVSPSTAALPAFLCLTIIFGGLVGPAAGITADREDGTLLRAKATPNGMLGYVIGKVVVCALTTLLSFLVILVPGILIVSDLVLDARTWLMLTLIFVVGMVATAPIGIALGSIMKSSSQTPLVPLVSLLMVALSGLFFPLAVMPTWLQSLIQALPVYWVGLGTRSAMLPAEMLAAEMANSWRAIGMFAVPGAWAVMGLLLAPILLRRMARRQSGSALARVRASKGF